MATHCFTSLAEKNVKYDGPTDITDMIEYVSPTYTRLSSRMVYNNTLKAIIHD